MAILTKTRRRFQFASLAMLGMVALTGVYLLFPVGMSNSELEIARDAAQRERLQQEKLVRPLRNLPAKLTQSQADIARFQGERLPARFSVVSSTINAMAAKHRVAMAEIKYKPAATELPELQLLEIDASLSGKYGDLVRFINGVERSKVFFLVNSLTLAEQKGTEQKAAEVKLELKMETYLRQRTQANEK